MVPPSDSFNVERVELHNLYRTITNKFLLPIIFKGPTLNTIHDMWRMVWEKRCYSIVMVTNLEELGKVRVSSLHSTTAFDD